MHRPGLSASPREPELAVTISDARQLDAAGERIEEHRPTRVHFGNEFCERLLPTEAQLDRALALTHELGLELSVVLPYLAEPAFRRATRLVEHLAERRPDTEVVVNDWGLLRFVAGLDDLRPVLGRALNRTLADPRIPEHLADDLPREAMDALRGGALGSPAYSNLLERYRVRRIEVDVSPLGLPMDHRLSEVAISLHLPYTYVATGRVCLFAGLGRRATIAGRRFTPGACRYECSRFELDLTAPPPLAGRWPLVQRGNTVFAVQDVSLAQRLEEVRGLADRLVWSREIPMGGGPRC